jgi:hypothetical protein
MPCKDFRIVWNKENIVDVISRKSGGNLEHDLRLWEADAAVGMKITLEGWYRLPLIEREQIIASKLANRWIDNLIQEYAVEEARRNIK